MENEETLASENLAHLTIYNVPESVGHEFQKIMKRYRGNSGKSAFTELVERFYIGEMVGRLVVEINELKDRIERLENEDKKKVKTFGGHEV